MAKKMSDEEREKLIIEVANDAIKTADSYKKLGERHGISNATVNDYLYKRLPILDPDRFKKVNEIYSKKNPQKRKNSINTIKRIFKEYNLVMKGKSLEEISKITGETIMVVQRDLQSRLPQLSERLGKMVQGVLKYNSFLNLKNFDEDLSKEIDKYRFNDVELKILISGCSYITNNSLDDIMREYNIQEDDLLGALIEVLPHLDNQISEKVNDKLIKENLMTKLQINKISNGENRR